MGKLTYTGQVHSTCLHQESKSLELPRYLVAWPTPYSIYLHNQLLIFILCSLVHPSMDCSRNWDNSAGNTLLGR
jgi:hypothetical protein